MSLGGLGSTLLQQTCLSSSHLPGNTCVGRVGDVCLFVCLFETWSHNVALAGLELTI